jgi:hypothetical protein
MKAMLKSVWHGMLFPALLAITCISPATGGGYVKAGTTPSNTTSFTDSGLRNAQTYFYSESPRCCWQ